MKLKRERPCVSIKIETKGGGDKVVTVYSISFASVIDTMTVKIR